jgi:hypothetical protein
MKCLQCDSLDIIKGVKPVDKGEGNWRKDLELEVYKDPEAWLFKGPEKAVLMTNVCADCGYVMWNISVSDAKRFKKYQA